MPRERGGLSRTAALVAGGALLVGAASLALPWTLAFDPWAWLVWGRDLTRLTLDTSAGPSWKPLPVLMTTPFTLTGDAAPALWLVVARAGGLLALAAAATLAARVAGRVAGAAAAVLMALSPWWLFNTALGNSEGLLVAAVLWAVVAQLAGRRRTALALGATAALLRPEVWPFLALYGAWCWRADRRTRPVVAAAAIAVPLLWFAPDLMGTGGAALASRAARGEPSPGSAGLADVPGLAVLGDAAEIATVPAAIAAVAAVVVAVRRRDALVLALAAGALGGSRSSPSWRRRATPGTRATSSPPAASWPCSRPSAPSRCSAARAPRCWSPRRWRRPSRASPTRCATSTTALTAARRSTRCSRGPAAPRGSSGARASVRRPTCARSSAGSSTCRGAAWNGGRIRRR